jgi:Periplasmic binding protein
MFHLRGLAIAVAGQRRDHAVGRRGERGGDKMKAEYMATGYGQPLLDQPVSKSFGPEIVLSSIWAPVEIKSKASKRFQADLEKYAGYTGVPDFGVFTGYITCDLAILGLQQQGDDLDPTTFSEDLRSVGQFNPGGGSGAGTGTSASRPTARPSHRAVVSRGRADGRCR